MLQPRAPRPSATRHTTTCSASCCDRAHCDRAWRVTLQPRVRTPTHQHQTIPDRTATATYEARTGHSNYPGPSKHDAGSTEEEERSTGLVRGARDLAISREDAHRLFSLSLLFYFPTFDLTRHRCTSLRPALDHRHLSVVYPTPPARTVWGNNGDHDVTHDSGDGDDHSHFLKLSRRFASDKATTTMGVTTSTLQRDYNDPWQWHRGDHNNLGNGDHDGSGATTRQP
ncbi:hypothetical protein EDB85DRAFT_1887415 [Lactarius pseudohatsudake]|nr:hypothetical protein EDB85DRAFT_1887415 [Lactarius pseudohatsudake]